MNGNVKKNLLSRGGKDISWIHPFIRILHQPNEQLGNQKKTDTDEN